MKLKSFVVCCVLVFGICSSAFSESKKQGSSIMLSKFVIDGFEDVKEWRVIKPAETELKLSSEKGLKGNCMRMEYGLGAKKLYVVAAKDVSKELPENYRFVFYVKGASRDNNIEFKLTDDKGNVFWKKWENYRVQEFWEKITVDKEDIVYAWGPDSKAKLSNIKTIEFGISSGSDVIGRPAPGGKGSIFIEELSLIPLPRAYETGRSGLINSGFENGTKSWQVSANTMHKGCFPFQCYEGGQSFGFGNDGGVDGASGKISQKIALARDIKEGDIFVFSMWMKGEDKYSGKAFLSIDFIGTGGNVLKSYSSKTQQGKFDWNKISVSGSVPEGSKQIVLNCASDGMKKADGGSFIWFDAGELESPSVSASSMMNSKYYPGNILLEAGSWQSGKSDREWILIDFGRIKKFSGIEIMWDDDDYAKEYKMLVSIDGKKWAATYIAKKETGGKDTIYLDKTYARHIKIDCSKASSGKGFSISKIKIKQASEILKIKNYFKMLAKKSPGYFPRWMLDQQVYWATTGTYDGDMNEAILCEDGSLEPHKRGFSVTPFIYTDGSLISRGDVNVTQSLEDIYLPIPSVKWDYNGLEMNVKLFTHGAPGASTAYARYTLENKTKKAVSGKFFLAVRPFQVYPPWQGSTDSFAPIHSIKCGDNFIEVDKEYKVFSINKADYSGSIAGGDYFPVPFKTPEPPELKGDITAFLKKGEMPGEKESLDMEGFASAAFGYDISLAPGEKTEFFIVMPLYEQNNPLKAGITPEEAAKKYDEMLAKDIKYWKSKIDIVDIDIPEMDIVYLMKSNIGYNLVTKDGPALQPGARSYDKAWWRDGSIQASSLLKLGLTKESKDFIDFLLEFQYETGEVPPIIDMKFQDPLWEEKPPTNIKEYDSQGQMIWAVLEYYYFSRDPEFLEKRWDNVYRNLKFMEELRKKRLTDEYPANDPDKSRFRGIFPQSRSHEGYWFEHSYWDDWWAVKGWKDALDIAKILKKKKSVQKWIEKEYEAFYKDLCASVIATAKFKGVDYISGCAEKGDYDPTSVAVSINYAGLLPRLREDLQPYLDNTFDSYYEEHIKRVEPGASFHYTPYEARNAPVLIYMGHKDRALSLIRFLLSCSRPYKWFQLAEVVNSDLRNPCYLGDMPHTWVGAEYMNSVRGLFVYEEFEKIILAGGVDEKWIERKEGISVKNMPTYFGKINYTMIKNANKVTVNVSGDADAPKGFVLKSPFMDKIIKGVEINGKMWKKFNEKEVMFEKLPAKITLTY